MARAGQIGGGSTDVYNPPTVPRSPTKRERRILGGYNDVPSVPNPTPKVPQVPKPRITDSGDLLTPTAARPQQGRIVNAPQVPGLSRRVPIVPGTAPATTAVTPTPPTTAAPEPTTTAAGNGAGAAPSTAAANPPETIAQSIDSIQNILKSATTPDQQAIGLAFMNRALDVIDQAQSQWMQYAKQTLNQVDPATLNAIANLKQTVADQRTRLMDQLNRANLLQSGIMLEMEDRINKNELNAQQSLLAKSLSGAMQQFQQGLLGFLNQRIATARQFGLQGMQEQFQAGQNAADRRQQLFGDLVPYTLGPTPYQQETLAEQRRNSGGDGSLATTGSGLTDAGYFSDFPSITPAIEREFGLTHQQIAAAARAAGVSNSQLIAAWENAPPAQEAVTRALNALWTGTPMDTVLSTLQQEAPLLGPQAVRDPNYIPRLSQEIQRQWTQSHFLGGR